jgi:hypothetical protein
MIDIAIATRLGTYPPDAVRAAIRIWATRHAYESKTSAAVLESSGWERVDAAPGTQLTQDGRPVIWAHGQAWAMTREAWGSSMQKAQAEAAAKRPAQPKPVREGIAAATCPQMSGGRPCGGTLNRSPVCPSCVTGRMGYRYRYTCEICGCDIVTREELR